LQGRELEASFSVLRLLLGICLWREGFEAVFGPEQRDVKKGEAFYKKV
jgi:uncharacterized membrane protein YphA (DoxX/SURF4 family)